MGSDSQSNALWTIAYLALGLVAFIVAFTYYWLGDLQKAIFWMLMGIACELSIIRRNTE